MNRISACLFFIILLPGVGAADERDREIERLKGMIEALESRIAALEANAAQPNAVQPGAAAAGPVAPPAVDILERERFIETAMPPGAERLGDLEAMSYALSRSGAERKETEDVLNARAETESPLIAFEGALRYNFFVNDSNVDTKRGTSGLDLFRVGASGVMGNFQISSEYRFFPFMDTIHHGWIGYEDPELGAFQLGVSQVPFGILPFASHNYWFGVPFYLGLADDYDLGLKWIRDRGPWNFQAAFYKNEELGSAGDLERISFDLVQAGEDQANEESNQLNARIAYTAGKGTDSLHEIGLSLQGGEIFNSITEGTGTHWAAGLHLDSRIRRWNFQLEALRYEYNPKNPEGVSDSTVRLGGFATSYDVSAEGTVGVANIAYNVPLKISWMDSLLVYNDFSVVFKDQNDAEESILNTTGAAIGMGPLFLYLDLIQARNMVFFEDGSLAGEGNRSWDYRLNFNIGYYW